MSVNGATTTSTGAGTGAGRQLPSDHIDENADLPPSSPGLPTLPPQNNHSRRSHSHYDDGAPQFMSDFDRSTNNAPKKERRSSSSKPAPKKKKGTATTIKAPKRARQNGGSSSRKSRGGGGSGSVSGVRRKTDMSAATLPSETGGSYDGSQDGRGGNSSESDSGPYCLCRGPDNHRFMIACDRCEDWFHGECIGMDKYTGENLVQRYMCPNCSDGDRYVTRYKKICSLEGCTRPARIYSLEDPSIFCSEEHCQAWWEHLIATLPRSKDGTSADTLTQDEFLGLLDAPKPKPGEKGPAWKLGDPPFGVSDDFWKTVDLNEALTSEEREILSRSAAERYALGEEIGLCQKMLQLIDMALKRRDAAIAAGKGSPKETCGYDWRLDTVDVAAQFAAFVKSPAGETIFKTGRLDAPDAPQSPTLRAGLGAFVPAEQQHEADPLTAGMCTKKKCKPHLSWATILGKSVKHSIKELAAQAKEKLDLEARVRDSAAGRFRRKLHENNSVTVVGDDIDMSDASTSEREPESR
ncbi:hypothetical protein B0T22DRAFT_437850 [Podospora appendiculata]|uniref:PHD-type domain-containing protein n=1 Tax=Podospora appendiculata TaxID=314037 RepID=A0AAE0XJQ7_9PEZI|nr:hypothetical protein B0T22DRAFT_437850 [Podospora appendiculata]